jgi:hypothetical protein
MPFGTGLEGPVPEGGTMATSNPPTVSIFFPAAVRARVIEQHRISASLLQDELMIVGTMHE